MARNALIRCDPRRHSTALRVPADLEERIRQKVESGEYDDAVAVIRAAMRLLDRRDAQLQKLRALVAEGWRPSSGVTLVNSRLN
jgi:putative addiction module CopG family antidote